MGLVPLFSLEVALVCFSRSLQGGKLPRSCEVSVVLGVVAKWYSACLGSSKTIRIAVNAWPTTAGIRSACRRQRLRPVRLPDVRAPSRHPRRRSVPMQLPSPPRRSSPAVSRRPTATSTTFLLKVMQTFASNHHWSCLSVDAERFCG